MLLVLLLSLLIPRVYYLTLYELQRSMCSGLSGHPSSSNERLELFVALMTVPVFSSSNSGLHLTYLIEQVSRLEQNRWQYLEGSSHSIGCHL